LNEIYGSPRARSHDSHPVQRPVQHYWSQCDLVLGAQLGQLRYHDDKIRCVCRASCNTLIQFLADATQQMERALLVLWIDHRLEPVWQAEQLLGQAPRTTENCFGALAQRRSYEYMTERVPIRGKELAIGKQTEAQQDRRSLPGLGTAVLAFVLTGDRLVRKSVRRMTTSPSRETTASTSDLGPNARLVASLRQPITSAREAMGICNKSVVDERPCRTPTNCVS
jgi:hypothetical protein